MLPLSHDEVVHGKGSILGRMPGDQWQRFANPGAYYGFMWGQPGRKLLFMRRPAEAGFSSSKAARVRAGRSASSHTMCKWCRSISPLRRIRSNQERQRRLAGSKGLKLELAAVSQWQLLLRGRFKTLAVATSGPR